MFVVIGLVKLVCTHPPLFATYTSIVLSYDVACYYASFCDAYLTRRL